MLRSPNKSFGELTDGEYALATAISVLQGRLADPVPCEQALLVLGINQDFEFLLFQDIENFAEGRQKRGVNVTTVCFENSEHVKHYISHPSKYIYYVCKFINDCLSIPYNGVRNLVSNNGAEKYSKID